VTLTLAALVHRAADRLRGRLPPEQNAALDAEVLARHVLGWDRARWIAEARSAPPEGFESEFGALVARRLEGEPVAYLTGRKEFWDFEFEVSPDVLVPRPETELLVEQTLQAIDERYRDDKPFRVADVGTGSGCIAIAIAASRPAVRVVATDISPRALAIARRNAARLGVAGRIEFLETTLLEAVTRSIDLVVSNPPYIGTGDAARVTRDVAAFEPPEALFAGADGLEVINRLIRDAATREPVPVLLFEFGGNESDIRAAAAASGLRVVRVTPDLAGIPRVARVEA
jgi:release factor glutamine methyltransferase